MFNVFLLTVIFVGKGTKRSNISEPSGATVSQRAQHIPPKDVFAPDGSLMSDRAAKLLDPYGRLELLAECDEELRHSVDDNDIKAIRARQSGIRTASDIANTVELKRQVVEMQEGLAKVLKELGANRGGVDRASGAIAFPVATGRDLREDN